MPAHRSRTAEWKRSMTQVFERGGAIEVAIAHADSSAEERAAGDLIWRLHVVELRDEDVLVEFPTTAGMPLPLHSGVDLIGAITVGQNRWTFRTRTLGELPGRAGHFLRLQLPDSVERCQRRHARLELGGLTPPVIDAFPLLNPASVHDAQVAYDAAARQWLDHRVASPEPTRRPEVGPPVNAELMNIAAGGVGLRVEPVDAAAFTRHRTFWLRIPLGASMPVPIVVAAKLAHTRLDSSQRTYLGLGFDFSFHPAHADTLARQLARYAQDRQAAQRS